MTRINKLVMHGFKSFANKTELEFGEGFNCVLGPNGSGKSNILDALCFVLGRLSSKSMRAEKAANLVYNGGKEKKPMKQGEVSLYFDNTDKTFPTEDPQVKITRVIKDDGQSVYLINDEKRTRQQILDLMSIARIDPDGHNIILQGDIIGFTEMHPEERRQIIEEISGISVYEDKKLKALKELEKVEERLKEAGIVLAEREAHLRELKKERDQALKFKELEIKIKENKASYLYLQMDQKQQKCKELGEKINAHKEQINKFNSEIAKLKESIQKNKDEIENITKEIEQKSETEQVSLQKEIERLKIKQATDNQRIEHCKVEIEKIDARKEELNKSLNDLNDEIKELNQKKEALLENKDFNSKELKKIEEAIHKFKITNSLEDAASAEKQVDELDKEIEARQSKIEELRKKQHELLRKKDSTEYQIRSIDEQIDKVLELEKGNKEQIDKLKKDKEEFKKSILELNQRLNEDSSFAAKIGEHKERLSKLEENLGRLNTRNASMREHILGNVAVKSILELKRKGVFGTISELGSVKSEYALALEVAAGPRMNSIVVEDDAVAASCIRHLKEKKLGTAVFLPLNKIKPKDVEDDSKNLLGQKGVHGLAVDLIDFDKKFEKAFSHVFGSTLIVDDIETARKLGIGRARMTTLDGDIAEFSGAMQGGFRQKKISGFQEKELIKEISDCETDISALEEEIGLLINKRSENEKLIDSLRQKKAALEGEVIKQEKSLHLDKGDLDASRQKRQLLEKELETASEELSKIEDSITDINKDSTNLRIKKQELKNRLTELRSPSLMAELNAFEEKKNSLKEDAMKIENDIRSITTEINDIKDPEKERIAQILKNHSKEAEDFTEEINDLAKLIESTKKDLEKKDNEAKEFYMKNKEMLGKKVILGDEIQQHENSIEQVREKSKDVEIKMNELSLKSAESHAQFAGLNEEFKQYEGVAINKEKDEATLRDEIAKFERTIIEIGSVNMRALDIYEGIEVEYNVLLNKKSLLAGEKEDVVGMMNEIEGKKKELFMKAFDEVNDKFKTIFSELLSKGEASLELENPDSPFEAGLTVKVKVAGRKFLDIRSLSGGEKTMTALAFIFSIQEYEPHSFYILDEIDAALDKHNSERVSKLIRKYADNAQYIVISHNDAIITEADILYGISKNEHEISQATSLKI